jgi:sensor histidine kinase YesM
MTLNDSMKAHVPTPKKWWESAIHIVGWCILIGAPFFFTGHNDEMHADVDFYFRHFIGLLSFIAVFYLNYFLLIPKLLFSKRTGQFFVSNFLLIMLAMLFVHVMMLILPQPPKPFWHHAREIFDVIGFILYNVFLYILVIGMSVAIKMTAGWYQVETIRRELEQKNTEAELQNLKSQLNPHFLFNTLNNIYSLIDIDSAQAQKAVHGLSHLLRYVLYESSQPTVPLEKEIDFVRNYVELMRLRLTEQVTLTTDYSIENNSLPVAPLIFITLIENAFKHGVSNDEPSFINLSIHQQEGRISCRISNSYFPKDKEQDKSGSGIGIPNLSRRLELLYPSRHIFTYGKEGNEYRTVLDLQTK